MLRNGLGWIGSFLCLGVLLRESSPPIYLPSRFIIHFQLPLDPSHRWALTTRYMLLIPLNLFGLALPTTNLLTYVPPTYVALELLEKPHTTGNDARVKILLSYFVTLGFVQFLESLAAGVLARRIRAYLLSPSPCYSFYHVLLPRSPRARSSLISAQYYTLKLLFLAYLLHPKTQGAVHLQDRFFSRLVRPSKVGAVNTPPTSHSGVDSVNSSPKYPAAPTSATSAGDSSVFPSPSHASTGATGGSVTLPSGPGTGQGMEVPL